MLLPQPAGLPAAPPAMLSYGGAAELPGPPGACGRTKALLRGGGFRRGRASRPGLRFPGPLAGLHMLCAAPGTFRQLPVRRPVRRRDVRCRPRCGSRCDRRRGSRGGSRRFPVQLPTRFLVPFPAPPAVGYPAGVPSELTAEPRRRPGPERPPPRPGSMPRGRAWTQAEVSKLLSLVAGSGEAALLMGSTSRPNEALWREISQGLGLDGYRRTVAQCRSKWKALKQAFHSERETRQKAGHPSSRMPLHYRAMKNIWKAAGQPVFGERRMSGGCWGWACGLSRWLDVEC